MSDYDDYEREELMREARWYRRYVGRLASHPDCRDPDHPGCPMCSEVEDDEGEENENE